MIFRWLRRRAAAPTREQNAQRIAERAFASAYPDRRLVNMMTGIFNHDARGLVVQLCHDWGGIPPHRSWWRVSPDGTCSELSLDEASELRPIPTLR